VQVFLCGFFLLRVFVLCRPAGLQIRCRVEGFLQIHAGSFVQVCAGCEGSFVQVGRVFLVPASLQGFVRLAQLSRCGFLCEFFLVRFLWVHAGVWGLGFVQICAGSFFVGCMEF